MKKNLWLLLLSFVVKSIAAQTLSPLTVEKIMRDQKWIGTSPASINWSADGHYLFFNWNPTKADEDSVYYITPTERTPKKASYEMRQPIPLLDSIEYNRNKTAYAYAKDGDVYYFDDKTKSVRRITQTVETETSPRFIVGDTKVVYARAQNLYAWEIATGLTTQLTNFQRGTAPKDPVQTAQEKSLQKEAVSLSEIIKERKRKRDTTEA